MLGDLPAGRPYPGRGAVYRDATSSDLGFATAPRDIVSGRLMFDEMAIRPATFVAAIIQPGVSYKAWLPAVASIITGTENFRIAFLFPGTHWVPFVSVYHGMFQRRLYPVLLSTPFVFSRPPRVCAEMSLPFNSREHQQIDVTPRWTLLLLGFRRMVDGRIIGSSSWKVH